MLFSSVRNTQNKKYLNLHVVLQRESKYGTAYDVMCIVFITTLS